MINIQWNWNKSPVSLRCSLQWKIFFKCFNTVDDVRRRSQMAWENMLWVGSLATSKALEHNESGGDYPAQWRGTPNVAFPFQVIKENLYCMVMQSDDKNTSVVKITEQWRNTWSTQKISGKLFCAGSTGPSRQKMWWAGASDNNWRSFGVF